MTLPVELPPPRDWQDFEDFCWELFSAEWGDPEAKKHGRSGQAQQGVDILGRRDGQWHAVQCKRRSRYPETSLSQRDARAEVKAAKQLSYRLATFVIATTAPHSTTFSDLAVELTDEAGFRVEVYGWEELVRRLQRHPDLYQRWRALLGITGLPHFAGVPPRNPHFQGRDELLDELAQRLSAGATTALTQTVAGLGGVGKTQTALEYCYRHADRYRFVIWANAQSPELLVARYVELARQAGLATGSTPVDQAVTAFLSWLARERSWLLVLDNVEERPQDLELPAGGTGHVLITTRLRSLPQALGSERPFAVDVLPVEEATAFLLERVGRSGATAEEGQAASELATELDGLPLALEQAAAYLDDLQLPFAAYLDLLRRKRQVLALEQDSWGITGGYEKDVASTWLLNMEQLPTAAAEVMNACAFLAPERIPLSLFIDHGHLLGPALSALAEELRSEPDAAHRHLVRPLTRFSLFRFDPESQELSLHRMVQWVARQRLEARAEAAAMLQQAHAMVEAAFPREYDSPSVWAECSRLFPHVVALQRNWAASPGSPDFDPTILWGAAGFFACASGRSAQALELEVEVVAVRRRVLGEEHPRTLTSLNNLAETRRDLGDAEGARELLKRVVEVCRRVLGEEHPDTLRSLNNLAETRRALGDAEGARELQERLVEVLPRVLGEKHPLTLASLNNLAATRSDLGDAEGARVLHERVVEVCRRVLGEEHPDTLQSLNNLAAALRAVGDAEGARDLVERVVEVCRRVLGEEHPDTLNSLNNLAATRRALGDAEGACEIHERVLKVRRRVLGEEHPDTLTSLNNLAATRRTLGDAEGARELHERVVEVSRRVLGEEHPDTLISLNNLANTRWDMGDAEEARELQERVVEGCRRVLGEEHPTTRTALENLAAFQDD